jgi:CheY-like chemotaxis protein
MILSKRIMVYNDTDEILELFKELLTDEGYEVVLASYGIEDIPLIEKTNPDLLILDYIPTREETGWQLLQKLKMKHSTENIPVVICTTAYKLAEEIQGYLTEHRVEVVRKPFNIEDLLAAVKRALELPQNTPSGKMNG